MKTEQTCRFCGCTDSRACRGGCYWVKPGLCSTCAEKHAGALVDSVVAWVHRRPQIGLQRIDVDLGGRTATIEYGGPAIIVRDHLRLPIFTLDDGGYTLAPHYDAHELMPLFARERETA